MFLRRIVAFFLFAFSTTALADAIDINLRDSSAQLQYSASLGQGNIGKSEIHLGFLHTNKSSWLTDMGLLVKDEVGSNAPGVTVGVGVKGLVAKSQSYNATALALGGLVRFSPLSDSRFGITGMVYLSPNIVTYGDADRYTETGLRLDYEVIPQAIAYVGYRNIKFGLKSLPNLILDEGVHIGVRISF